MEALQIAFKSFLSLKEISVLLIRLVYLSFYSHIEGIPFFT